MTSACTGPPDRLSCIPAQRHISDPVHIALGDVVSLFVRKEMCEQQRRAALSTAEILRTGPWPDGSDLGRIPPLHVMSSVRKTAFLAFRLSQLITSKTYSGGIRYLSIRPTRPAEWSTATTRSRRSRTRTSSRSSNGTARKRGRLRLPEPRSASPVTAATSA